MKFKLPLRIGALIRDMRRLSAKLDESLAAPIIRVKAVEIRPGDQIVLYVPGPLSMEACKAIRQQWDDHVKTLGIEGTKALVIERGMTIDVLRPNIQPSGLDE